MFTTHQLVQDFFHPQYDSISSNFGSLASDNCNSDGEKQRFGSDPQKKGHLSLATADAYQTDGLMPELVETSWGFKVH